MHPTLPLGRTGVRRWSRLSLLLQGSAIIYLGLLIGRGAGFYSRVLIGRGLGPSDLGRISAFVSAVVLTGAITSGGLQTTVTTFSARYRRSGDDASLGRLRQFAVLWERLAIAVVCLIAVATLAWRGSEDDAVLHAVILALSSSMFVALATRIAWFRGAGDARSSFLSHDLTKAVVYIGGLQALMLFGGLSVRSVLVAVLTSHAAALAISFVGAGRIQVPRLPQRRQRRRILFPGPDDVEREWVRFAAPLVTSKLLQRTAGRSIDVLLLSLLVSAREVGLYAAGLTIAGVLGLALQSVNYLALPDFAAEKDPSNAYRTRRRSLACWTLVGLVGWGTGAGALVEPVFGQRFDEAAGLIVVFMFGHFTSNFVGPVGPLTLAAGRSGLHLWADLASILTFWATIVLFVPTHGIIAAAAARALSQTVFNALLASFTFPTFGIRLADPVVLLAAGTATAVGVVTVVIGVETAGSAVAVIALVAASTAGLARVNHLQWSSSR